jgi:hypothetical protein
VGEASAPSLVEEIKGLCHEEELPQHKLVLPVLDHQIADCRQQWKLFLYLLSSLMR